MVNKAMLNNAIIAHMKWKEVLMDAITNESSELDFEFIKKDDQCEFGKWLINLPEEAKNSEIFKKVDTLHSAFHKSAAEVIKLVQSGEKRKAEESIFFGGDYNNNSHNLMNAINEWKKMV